MLTFLPFFRDVAYELASERSIERGNEEPLWMGLFIEGEGLPLRLVRDQPPNPDHFRNLPIDHRFAGVKSLRFEGITIGLM